MAQIIANGASVANTNNNCIEENELTKLVKMCICLREERRLRLRLYDCASAAAALASLQLRAVTRMSVGWWVVSQ